MRAAPKNIDICAEMRHQPPDLFSRHENCSCTVEYTSSTGAKTSARGANLHRYGTGAFVEIEHEPPHVGAVQGAEKAPHRLTGGENGGIIIPKPSFTVSMQRFAERDIERQESGSLKRAIRKYNQRIAEHKEYIRNPKVHCPDWDSYSEQKKNGLVRHWEKEIRNFEESIQNRVDELKRRGDYDE